MKGKTEENEPSTLVMIAALNEEKGIGPTLSEIKYFMDEASFLVIDGRSRDDTVKVAKEMGAQVIFQKNNGKGDAIGIAIEHAKNLNVKYVALIDADYTYPAEYLPKMVKILEENPKVGMVCGNRFNGNLSLKAMKHVFYLGNKLIAYLHSLLNGVRMKDPLTGLRVVRWELLKNWRPRSKGFDIEVEMNHYVEKRGYEILEIPIRYRTRLGDKKLKLRHGLSILKRILIEALF